MHHLTRGVAAQTTISIIVRALEIHITAELRRTLYSRTNLVTKDNALLIALG